MMNLNTRIQLKELIEDETLPEWQRSSRLLGLALSYCRSALEETRERAALLQGLAALSEALKAGSTSLGSLGDIFQKAGPGANLKQALDQSRAAFLGRQKELAELQVAIAELENSESVYKEMEIERDRLRSRLEYLERLRQVDPQELEKLRKQVKDQDDGDVAINIVIS